MAWLIHLSLLLAARIQLFWGSAIGSQTCSLCSVTFISHQTTSFCHSDDECKCVEINKSNSPTDSRLTLVCDKCPLYNKAFVCNTSIILNDQHQCLEVTVVCQNRFCIVYSEGQVLINKSSTVASRHCKCNADKKQCWCDFRHFQVLGNQNDVISTVVNCVLHHKCQLKVDICNSAQSLTTEINKKYAGLRFYEEPKSWIDALEYCSSISSNLVEITNKTMQAAVNKLLLRHIDSVQCGAVWIGLERSIFGREDIPWSWISGNEAVKPEWNGSFPVDRFNNHCGKIVWVEELLEFKWLDGWCFDKLPFICYPSLQLQLTTEMYPIN